MGTLVQLSNQVFDLCLLFGMTLLKFSKEAESEKLLIFITIYSQLLIGPVLKDKPELTVLPRGLGSILGSRQSSTF